MASPFLWSALSSGAGEFGRTYYPELARQKQQGIENQLQQRQMGLQERQLDWQMTKAEAERGNTYAQNAITMLERLMQEQDPARYQQGVKLYESLRTQAGSEGTFLPDVPTTPLPAYTTPEQTYQQQAEAQKNLQASTGLNLAPGAIPTSMYQRAGLYTPPAPTAPVQPTAPPTIPAMNVPKLSPFAGASNLPPMPSAQPAPQPTPAAPSAPAFNPSSLFAPKPRTAGQAIDDYNSLLSRYKEMASVNANDPMLSGIEQAARQAYKEATGTDLPSGAFKTSNMTAEQDRSLDIRQQIVDATAERDKAKAELDKARLANDTARVGIAQGNLRIAEGRLEVAQAQEKRLSTGATPGGGTRKATSADRTKMEDLNIEIGRIDYALRAGKDPKDETVKLTPQTRNELTIRRAAAVNALQQIKRDIGETGGTPAPAGGGKTGGLSADQLRYNKLHYNKNSNKRITLSNGQTMTVSQFVAGARKEGSSETEIYNAVKGYL